MTVERSPSGSMNSVILGSANVISAAVNFTVPLSKLIAPVAGDYIVSVTSPGLVSVTFTVNIYPGGSRKLSVTYEAINSTDSSGKSYLLITKKQHLTFLLL